jgi:DNA-binding LytR/AlgR family response regulator
MQTFRCLIVDDEPDAHYVLEAHIDKVQALQLAGNCYNAMEAANFMHRERIDILLLDINMPELTGFDLLRSLQYKPWVILTTAYNEYALESYEYDVVDYLLKPVRFPRFLKAVNKIILQPAVAAKPDVPDMLLLKTGNSHTEVAVKDIHFVQSMGNYVKVFLDNKFIIASATTAEMEKLLPDSHFIRIHKSYIVAVDKITEVGARQVNILQQSLPVGQTFKMNLLKRKGLA